MQSAHRRSYSPQKPAPWMQLQGARRALAGPRHGLPDTVEGLFEQGLRLALRDHDLAGAQSVFERACRSDEPTWTAAARVALALCLLQRSRSQRALRELRKVAYGAEAPNAMSVKALEIMAAFLETGGQARQLRSTRLALSAQLASLHGPARPTTQARWPTAP